MRMSVGSSGKRNQKLNHGKFNILEMSETGGANVNSPLVNSGLREAACNLVTTTKLTSPPQITLKSVLLIVFMSIGITALAIMAAVLTITNIKSQSSETLFANGSGTTHSTLTTSQPLSNSSTSSPLHGETTLSTSRTTEAPLLPTNRSLSTTEPISSLCKSSEFSCLSSQCIPRIKVCDGLPDCEDGTDEKINCKCTEQQFRCSNGQCISKSSVCDTIIDCLNKEDEENCADCHGFQCKSTNQCLWDQMTRKCDGIFDCQDYSDEMNCSRGLAYTKCKNGIEVLNSLWCDGLDDCGDNTDEETCVCVPPMMFSCSQPKGKCIPNTWLCDGVADCHNGADEHFCVSCSIDQFQCKDYTCIPLYMNCDGKIDCKYSASDEEGCVKVGSDSKLSVTLAGQSLFVCSDSWSKNDSANVCSSMQKRFVSTWFTTVPTSMKDLAVLNDKSWNIAKSINHSFYISDFCLSSKIVNIKCEEQAECGERKTDFLESFVAGGSLSPLGKWPWVVSLSYLDNLICGGVLIGDHWVMTAAHCLVMPFPDLQFYDFKKTPFYFTITAGTTLNLRNTTRSLPSNQIDRSKVVRVAEIVLHPLSSVLEETGGVDWDLALLKLEKDVAYTDVIQPICLPPHDYVFLPTSYCFLAGWGKINNRQYMRAQKLRDARMQVWSQERCSRNKVAGESVVNINSTICTGNLNGLPTGCQGDSGSPLMCLDSVSGRYWLAGIMSKGSSHCGESSPRIISNRFARVSTSVQWIWKTISTN